MKTPVTHAYSLIREVPRRAVALLHETIIEGGRQSRKASESCGRDALTEKRGNRVRRTPEFSTSVCCYAGGGRCSILQSGRVESRQTATSYLARARVGSRTSGADDDD